MVKQLKYVGRIRCVLDLPSMDMHEDRRFLGPNQIAKVRRFVRNWIPTTNSALEEATLTISADVRYWEHQGDRRVVLCRWRAGESIKDALNLASSKWKKLNEEKQPTLRT